MISFIFIKEVHFTDWLFTNHHAVCVQVQFILQQSRDFLIFVRMPGWFNTAESFALIDWFVHITCLVRFWFPFFFHLISNVWTS